MRYADITNIIEKRINELEIDVLIDNKIKHKLINENKLFKAQIQNLYLFEPKTRKCHKHKYVKIMCEEKCNITNCKDCLLYW